MSNQWVGAHVSAAGGLSKAVGRAAAMGASAFSLFLKNQKQWCAKPLSPEDVAQFSLACQTHGFEYKQILPHAGYLINLGSPDPNKLAFSRKAFKEELERCQALGLGFLNVHPGAHLGSGIELCLKTIADSINLVVQQIPSVSIVLENTAGQGTQVGFKFEHLAKIIEQVERKEHVGVCLDTCHAFNAGYDLRSLKACEEVFTEFNRVIGLQYLRGMHLNDSKTPYNSRKDRHECLGKGHIGTAVFQFVMRDRRFVNMPMILETPDPSQWPSEIAWLNQQAVDKNILT